ncbi:hypothetical protein CDAR_510371 [Caerostris darwini]|uniref:Uncharacterized protein n=1 Tax=Caerostris darwini TaxID=1538125 RepID=A0AAV4UY11_9ARAC|nr:hypothetical protein CDAR_510371 [Caerostris darwini]
MRNSSKSRASIGPVTKPNSRAFQKPRSFARGWQLSKTRATKNGVKERECVCVTADDSLTGRFFFLINKNRRWAFVYLFLFRILRRVISCDIEQGGGRLSSKGSEKDKVEGVQ